MMVKQYELVCEHLITHIVFTCLQKEKLKNLPPISKEIAHENAERDVRYTILRYCTYYVMHCTLYFHQSPVGTGSRLPVHATTSRSYVAQR